MIAAMPVFAFLTLLEAMGVCFLWSPCRTNIAFNVIVPGIAITAAIGFLVGGAVRPARRDE